MCPVDMKCGDCKNIFEVDKGSVASDSPQSEVCPQCGSYNTWRLFGCQAISVGEGKCGNAKTKYSTSVVYHPNSLTGKVKGKKV